MANKDVSYTFEVVDYGSKGRSKDLPLRHVTVTGRGATVHDRRMFAYLAAFHECKADGAPFHPIIAYRTPAPTFTKTVTGQSGAVLFRGKRKPLPFRGADRLRDRGVRC